ncbi:hypothetical protein XENORESO_021398, partial [Xenotaenia resolanae]
LFSALAALFVSALLISVIFAIIPVCNNVLILAIAMAVSGLAMGIIDTIANIQLVTIYQKDSAIFLQALHFFIGFGALVSPLIADPFLSETGCGNHTGNGTEIMHHFRSMLRYSPIVEHNITQSHVPHDGGEKEESIVQYAFWIMALINLPVPVAVLFLMYREQLLPCCPGSTPRLLDKDELAMETQQGAEGPDLEQKEDKAGGHGSIFSCCQNDNLRGLPASFIMIHILGGMVLFMTDGIVGAYAGFVYTYAVAPPMSLPNKTAGYLASIFWAAITAGRLLSIPLSYRFQPVRILMFNLIIQTEGSYSFLLCGMIIACIGFIFFIATTPTTTKNSYLAQKERSLWVTLRWILFLVMLGCLALTYVVEQRMKASRNTQFFNSNSFIIATICK